MADRTAWLLISTALVTAGCARAGDPCGAHDACGAGLCHVGRCTGSGAPVVAAGATRLVTPPSRVRALDDDGDSDEVRLASTRGVARIYAAFDVERRAGDRVFFVLEPVPDAPPWDGPVTLDVHAIEEPWSREEHEPRVGARAFSVTLEAGPARRIVLDVSDLPSRHGIAVRGAPGAGVGARVDARAVHLDVYR